LLKADIDTIISRIQGDANRPSLKEGMTFREEQKKVLEERALKYQKAADVEVDTSILSINQAVEKILENI
jgi:shikimate kinase